MKENNVKNIIDLINTNLDKLDINRVDKSITDPFLPDTIGRKREDSFISSHSLSTINSKTTNKTLESVPFNEEKDLDLPNFTSTKYKPLIWRIFHSLTYFLYTVFFMGSTICFYFNSNTYNIILTISNGFFFISIFMQWFYYKRGCIGDANYNTEVKNNIDKSFKAKLLRAEEGWKYFFALIGSSILIVGNIYSFIFSDEADMEFWNANMIGTMIISLSQILKLEKILTENKQYVVRNDVTNCLIEIFLFFGSLLFGASYYIQITYSYDLETFNLFVIILKFVGNVLILFSGIIVFHRYFLSDYEDLNASDLSNVTIY